MARFTIIAAVVFALLVVGANAQLSRTSKFHDKGLPKPAEGEPSGTDEAGYEIKLQCESLGYPYWQHMAGMDELDNYYENNGVATDPGTWGGACPVTATLVSGEEVAKRGIMGEECQDGTLEVVSRPAKGGRNHDRSVAASEQDYPVSFGAVSLNAEKPAGNCRGGSKVPALLCKGSSARSMTFDNVQINVWNVGDNEEAQTPFAKVGYSVQMYNSNIRNKDGSPARVGEATQHACNENTCTPKCIENETGKTGDCRQWDDYHKAIEEGKLKQTACTCSFSTVALTASGPVTNIELAGQHYNGAASAVYIDALNFNCPEGKCQSTDSCQIKQ